MKPKRTPRPALPPPGLRPKLRRDQLRDLALCHIQSLDSIARGDATELVVRMPECRAVELMGKAEREHTPSAFAEWLVTLARRSSVEVAA